MLMSIEYCHRQGIVHRDVKLENFLVDITQDAQIIIKLTDFGLASRYNPDNQALTLMCGSLQAVAPEVLIGLPYDEKVDLWGLGIILHEMLSTELPFYSDDDLEYKHKIIH